MNAPAHLPDALSKQRLRVWLRLLRATRYIENEVREGLRIGHDTTLPRFDVLAMLDRSSGGLRMSELSAQLMVSNGNVTGIVERLVQDGLVERVAVEGDRRATRVRLTKQGVETFAAMAAEHETWVNGLLGNLDENDSADLIRLLQRIGKDKT